MRALDKRLRRLEVGLLPTAQTEASGLYHATMLEISRNRARMLGEPLPDEVPGLEWTRQISTIGEILGAELQQMRARWAAEEGRARP